jgi:hypothetical protein
MAQAFSMPNHNMWHQHDSCQTTIACSCRFEPVSTTPPKRGIIPESANIVETRKSDLYIPIITYRRQWPAIPIPPISSPHSIPHSKHPAQMRHAPGTRYQQRHTRHTIRRHAHRSGYTIQLHTIRLTIYNATRSRLTALDYDMTHKQGRHRAGGR